VPLALGPRPLAAGGEARSEVELPEYKLKAVFLLNFIRYTTWPAKCFENEHSPFVLVVVGKDPFGSYLESTFQGEKVLGRTVEIRRARELPEKVEGHLVFCSELQKPERAELLRRCAGRPQLLIGETPGFAEQGAGINFFIEDLKTRFEVNTQALAESGLELSPSVLKLAKIVKTKHVEEER
jgi:hypothetical protein